MCMPVGFPTDVESLPLSVAGVERSMDRAAWHKIMKLEVDGHVTTGTYKAAAPPKGWGPIGATWVIFHKNNHDGFIEKLQG